MVSSNLSTFCGKPVMDFNMDDSIKDFSKVVYRLRLGYEDLDKGLKMEELLDKFAQIPSVSTIKELIIGQWDYDSSNDASELVKKLVSLKHVFKNLKSLFIGDITYEEQEISWIQQSDLSPILAAYPKLELFQIRGGDGLSLSVLNHLNLKTLIIETGGLPPNVVKEVGNANLPKLEKLELWLGSDDYGFDSKIKDFTPIFNGKKFPKLKFLGLKNSILQDEFAIEIASSAVLDQLETLDLSMGVLSDKGAKALLNSSKIKKLKFLNLNHHYMSKGMMDKLKKMGIPVSTDGQLEADEEGDRYVEVSE
jgi:hypothetical protein